MPEFHADMDSCYEIKQGKKKILKRVPSPGSRARINRARHETEISLIQKNAISQRLKGITSPKINILPLIF